MAVHLKISSHRCLGVIFSAALSVAVIRGDDAPCDVGYLKIMKDYAPDCINACQEVCSPLGQAAGVYFSGGDPVRQLCQHTKAFKCMVNNENQQKCSALLDVAQKEMGFAVPRSAALVDSTCFQTPAYDEKPAEDSTPAPDAATAPESTAAANDGTATSQASTHGYSTTLAVIKQASTTDSRTDLSGTRRIPLGINTALILSLAFSALQSWGI